MSPLVVWCAVIALSGVCASPMSEPASPMSPRPSTWQSAWSQHGYVTTCWSTCPSCSVPSRSFRCTSSWWPRVHPPGLLSSVPPTTCHFRLCTTAASLKPSYPLNHVTTRRPGFRLHGWNRVGVCRGCVGVLSSGFGAGVGSTLCSFVVGCGWQGVGLSVFAVHSDAGCCWCSCCCYCCCCCCCCC